MNKKEAIFAAKQLGIKQGFIYQFPEGHWSWCSSGSPIARSLLDNGFIYPEINVKAVKIESLEEAL